VWRARCFFDKVQLHRQLPDLALKRRDLRLVFSNEARLGLFAAQLSPVELGQPHVDEVGRDMVRTLRVAPTDHPGADVLAQLQLERR